MPATRSPKTQRPTDRKARTVTHACGHEQRHEDCPANWVPDLVEMDCTDCRRRGKDAVREREQEDLGWAELDGGFQAAQWARRIRDRLVREHPDLADDHPLQEALTDITSSWWWIDNREEILNVDQEDS